LIMIVIGGVLLYDYRISGIIEGHFKYSLDDLPRNYLWFSIEIATSIMILISLAFFIYSNV